MYLRCRCSVKFSLSGRDGDSNRFLSSWRVIPNTHPSHLINGFLGSPLVQLQESRVRPAPHPQGVHSARWSISPRTYTNGSPHILTTTRVRTFTSRSSGLSWATRLHGRNELSSQLSDRHAFNMTWGRTTNRSLTDTDGDRSTPKTSIPCCFSINILPGLHSLLTHGYFYDSQYSQPCFGIHLYLTGDRKSPDF